MKRQLIYLGLIVSFVLSSTNSNAQFWDTYQQSYGYFGNTLINPGFSIGLQRSVWDSDKGSGFAAPFGRTTLNGSVTTALYWDPFSHVAFVNYYECKIRQYLGQRLGVQFGAGPCFQMNFKRDNYVISDDFEIVNALGYEGEAILQTAEILAPVDVDFALDALANSFFVNNLLTTFFSGNFANNTLCGNGLVENSLTDELVKIEKPCLFLWGKYDMVVSGELAYDAFNRVGTSEKSFVIFERSGHSPMWQEGRLFAETIIDFMEESR